MRIWFCPVELSFLSRQQGRAKTMRGKAGKILITGSPGCGKTTAIKEIVQNLRGLKIRGFYTEEIRENRRRVGFRWSFFDGNSGILAHVQSKAPAKVGKYGVNVEDFEEAVVPVLNCEQRDVDLFVIDEIGKMECFSERFVSAVRDLLRSEKPVLATVARKGTGFISEAKNRPEVDLFSLSRDNYDRIVSEIIRNLSAVR